MQLRQYAGLCRSFNFRCRLRRAATSQRARVFRVIKEATDGVAWIGVAWIGTAIAGIGMACATALSMDQRRAFMKPAV
jgi:hypothetical protein